MLTVCLVLFMPLWGFADIEENQAELEKIRIRIEKAETELKQKRQSELAISRELVLLKKTLQNIDAKISDLTAQQEQVQNDISRQNQLINDNQQRMRATTGRLKKRLVALYKEGEMGALKILFSADSPTEMVQQYHYLTKVLEHDNVLLSEYRDLFHIQKQQLADLEKLQDKKLKLLENEQHQRQIAADGRRLQTRLLRQARNEKETLSRELTQLKENAARLKQLIIRLQEQPKNSSVPAADYFAVGRGKLRWPVEGRVVIGFGTQKDDKLGTYYESNGIEIAVQPGKPISAVASGKIVFADYFKGYGNLYILSHPGGYHSLYAHTDRMQKKLGEEVSAGDLLGYSGLGGRESIYFEIRSQGSPVNPLSWLMKR
ncbi:MAG: peptidoglycan DD-metalloendopeptidase family protein [Desulfuromonadales bacterium]|nr:peptidoglycan DD-metalloendopeptidase family protein [Desulfuromonadales bacterium]MBN2793389.1 peptidoglycan DD-metalloendopeptidase family protein [Desulfuromonadales bacterium]